MSTGVEIRAKEEFEKQKQLMDYQHELNKKLSRDQISVLKVSIIIATASIIAGAVIGAEWSIRRTQPCQYTHQLESQQQLEELPYKE